jgi:hypothetical protein
LSLESLGGRKKDLESCTPPMQGTKRSQPVLTDIRGQRIEGQTTLWVEKQNAPPLNEVTSLNDMQSCLLRNLVWHKATRVGKNNLPRRGYCSTPPEGRHSQVSLEEVKEQKIPKTSVIKKFKGIRRESSSGEKYTPQTKTTLEQPIPTGYIGNLVSASNPISTSTLTSTEGVMASGRPVVTATRTGQIIVSPATGVNFVTPSPPPTTTTTTAAAAAVAPAAPTGGRQPVRTQAVYTIPAAAQTRPLQTIGGRPKQLQLIVPPTSSSAAAVPTITFPITLAGKAAATTASPLNFPTFVKTPLAAITPPANDASQAAAMVPPAANGYDEDEDEEDHHPPRHYYYQRHRYL